MVLNPESTTLNILLAILSPIPSTFFKSSSEALITSFTLLNSSRSFLAVTGPNLVVIQLCKVAVPKW